MNENSWRHLFVSRETELAWLQAAWRESKAGRPQFRVLLGESGLGKTRLVQEFYRWLSREEDPPTPAAPEGYWPDAFESDRTSLDVNPAFLGHAEGTAPPIPWLWWGLRWVSPERRNEVANGCALIDFRANLEPHLRPILAARQLQQVRQDAGWKIVSLVGSLITQLSPLGWLPNARDAWLLVTEDRAKERKLLKATETSPADHAEADRRELETQVLETFRLILDPTKTQAPTVPVILALDDAQWADQVTLRFLSQLLRVAHEGGWCLLVLATHWEAEWHANVSDVPSTADSPTQLADLPGLLDLDARWAEARVILPVPDLGAIVSAALPGATPEQSRLILEKAGGNPRLLEEILRHLLDHDQFFEGRNTSRPLTKKAERDVRERSFDYHELVDERFCRLEEHVRRALGWSSSQGMRFLASLTEAIARRVDPEFDATRLRPALETAESPHSLVQLFRDQGRFNLGEFRQAAFQHVARTNLGYDEDELVLVESALRERLASWLEQEPDNTSHDLGPAEHRDALAMALRIFTPNRTETRRPWAIAMARLADLNASEFLWKQAHQLVRDLADAAPAGWSLEELPYPQQFRAISLLLQMSDLGRARRLGIALSEAVAPEVGQATGHLKDSDRIWTLNLVGDIYSASGNRAGALAAYQRGLDIAQRILDKSGDSPDALRDLSVSLNRVGDAERERGDRDAALNAFRRGLDIAQRILDEFGDSPQALRDLMISYIRMSMVSGDSKALDHLGRAEVLVNTIIARGWGSPVTEQDRIWIEGASLRYTAGSDALNESVHEKSP